MRAGGRPSSTGCVGLPLRLLGSGSRIAPSEAPIAPSRANVRKRGTTWTYYVYVTGGDGTRRQVTKGGFRTRKEAEAARIKALGTLQNGTWVQPERVTVREFLEDEWLPTQAPSTLDESTYRSY
jgi:hypothetical protein